MCNKSMIVSRIIFSHNKNFLIHFGSLFTISRCPANFPTPPAEVGHYPYFIDFEANEIKGKKGVMEHSYKLDSKPKFDDFQQFPIPDSIAQSDENEKVLNEILFVVNALTNAEFFRYKSRQNWTIRMDGSHESCWGQEGYIAPKYDRSLSELETFPQYTNPNAFTLIDEQSGMLAKRVSVTDLLELFFLNDNTSLKGGYLNACIVLSKSYELRQIDWSASYIFLVTAIEALIEIEYSDIRVEHCNSCGQPKHKVRKKFLNFLDKYGHKVDKKTKDLFYNLRSGIAHSGQLLGMSYGHKWSIESQREFDAKHKSTMDRIYYDSFHQLVTICFQTFIYQNFNNTHNKSCTQ